MALGVNVISSSSDIVSESPADRRVPSERLSTPPPGIDVTDIVRESPSGSVGVAMVNEVAASSVVLKVKLPPNDGLLLVLAGGGVGVDPPPPPPPPQAARASIAKLLNRMLEGPFSLNSFLVSES